MQLTDIPAGLLAGVDEAGRGPLAGPVIAAAVILDPDNPIEGLRDSKQLTEKRRESLYEEITGKAIAWATGRADVEEIDRINILQATLRAMRRAVEQLQPAAAYVLVDGNQCPSLDCPVEAEVPCRTSVRNHPIDDEVAILANWFIVQWADASFGNNRQTTASNFFSPSNFAKR